METPNLLAGGIFLPGRFFLRRGKRKKSKGTRSVEYGEYSRT